MQLKSLIPRSNPEKAMMQKRLRITSKAQLRPKNKELMRGKALMLCGAAATGDEITIHRLKILLSANTPIIIETLKEFIASKELQIEYEHCRCPECFKPVLKNTLVVHLGSHTSKTKRAAKRAKKQSENLGMVEVAKRAKPKKKYGGDAMFRAVSGGAFESNRRRH